MTKEILKGPRLQVELDPNQIFPKDPGQGTPIIVVLHGLSNKEFTGTWNCVTDTGMVDDVPLTAEQLKWLDKITPMVELWMHIHKV